MTKPTLQERLRLVAADERNVTFLSVRRGLQELMSEAADEIDRLQGSRDELLVALETLRRQFCDEYCNPNDPAVPHWEECTDALAVIAKAKGAG